MNFALSTKYPEIDFEEMRLSDVVLIGGGCGGGGGGGGSTSVTAAQVQAAAQSAAAIAGASQSRVMVEMTGSSSYIALVYNYQNGQTNIISHAGVSTATGTVTASSTSTSGGFWSSVGSFFSWLFGSH